MKKTIWLMNILVVMCSCSSYVEKEAPKRIADLTHIIFDNSKKIINPTIEYYFRNNLLPSENDQIFNMSKFLGAEIVPELYSKFLIEKSSEQRILIYYTIKEVTVDYRTYRNIECALALYIKNKEKLFKDYSGHSLKIDCSVNKQFSQNSEFDMNYSADLMITLGSYLWNI